MRSNVQISSKPANPDQFLGATHNLIVSHGTDNLPLYVLFEYRTNSNQIQTDEAEVIFSYEDGFGVPAQEDTLPRKWRITPPDPEGNALYKIPIEACVGQQHRKLRRRRYHANVRCRRYTE